MGVESGGIVSRSQKISGGRLPGNYDISVGIYVLDIYDNFAFSNVCKIK